MKKKLTHKEKQVLERIDAINTQRIIIGYGVKVSSANHLNGLNYYRMAIKLGDRGMVKILQHDRVEGGGLLIINRMKDG